MKLPKKYCKVPCIHVSLGAYKKFSERLGGLIYIRRSLVYGTLVLRLRISIVSKYVEAFLQLLHTFS